MIKSNFLKFDEYEHKNFNYNSNEFKKFKKPIIIRGGCKDTKAYKNWNKQYFKKKLKNLEIMTNTYNNLDDFQTKGVNEKSKIKQMEIDEIFEKLFNYPPHIYVCHNGIPDNLENDIVQKIDFIRNPNEKKAQFFLGFDSYTNAHIHLYGDFIINVCIGKKIFYMWSYLDNPKYSHIFKNFQDNHYIKENFFKLDHSKLRIFKAELNAGDSLLLPPWWYHAVYSPGFNCSFVKVYIRDEIGSKTNGEKIVYIRDNLNLFYDLLLTPLIYDLYLVKMRILIITMYVSKYIK